jgi:recombination protein RecR
MTQYSETIERLMQELGKLPGIGSRTAERLTFHLLKADADEALALAGAIHDLKTKIHPCRACFNPTEREVCSICSDSNRRRELVCVVEQPKDLLAIESTSAFNGLYHVLMGAIAPLDGIEPEDLTIDALMRRVEEGGVEEVILATNPTVAGDATALHLGERLRTRGIRVTRLARGLPAGGQIEYANKTILSDALNERRDVK